MSEFQTRDDAIRREIVEPIEATGVVEDAWAEFDVEAIADLTLEARADGYRSKVDPDEFWEIVMKNATIVD